jgi:3-dehydroquinate dehydratase-2
LRQVQPKILTKFVLACWLAEKKTVVRNIKKAKDAKAVLKNKFFYWLNFMKITIINGANLNLLGKREPHIYGSQTFEAYYQTLQKDFAHIDLAYFQSNVEGEIINKLHEIGFSADGIVLNAGAYTHTSIAIADAIASIKTSVIEVHISNVYAREEYRHKSYLSKYCKGVICGFGLESYRLALLYFAGLQK